MRAQLFLGWLGLCAVIWLTDYVRHVGQREGWERAMRANGCGIVAWGYEGLPFGYHFERPDERGWLCPGNSKVRYIDQPSDPPAER